MITLAAKICGKEYNDDRDSIALKAESNRLLEQSCGTIAAQGI